MQLEALAVRIYRQGEVLVLVPQRYGAIQPLLTQPRSSSRKLTIQEVLDNSLNADMRRQMEHIVATWQGLGFLIDPGTAGISCKADVCGKIVTSFWATPNETWGIQPNFADMEKKGIPPELISRLREDIGVLEGFPREKCLTSKYPVVRFSRLNDSSVQRFVELMAEAVMRWRKSCEESS